jgi:hypothetical protein
MKFGLTNNAVGFVRGVGALGDAIAPLSAGVDAGAVAAAERIGPRTWRGQAFFLCHQEVEKKKSYKHKQRIRKM